MDFRRGGAMDLPVASAALDCVVSGLVLNFVPDPVKAVTEMRRVARAGATIAAYVWDYGDGMEVIRRFWDAAIAVDPAARAADEAARFPICQPDPLQTLFTDAGLHHVRTGAIDIPAVFADFTDFRAPFLGGQGPAPSYCVALPEGRRALLRDHLHATLPRDPTGAITLRARAWMVRGTA